MCFNKSMDTETYLRKAMKMQPSKPVRCLLKQIHITGIIKRSATAEPRQAFDCGKMSGRWVTGQDVGQIDVRFHSADTTAALLGCIEQGMIEYLVCSDGIPMYAHGSAGWMALHIDRPPRLWDAHMEAFEDALRFAGWAGLS